MESLFAADILLSVNYAYIYMSVGAQIGTLVNFSKYSCVAYPKDAISV